MQRTAANDVGGPKIENKEQPQKRTNHRPRSSLLFSPSF
jgi:hypothetical protein